jgi:hypothetical protein
MNLKEIADKIELLSGVSAVEQPLIQTFLWFNGPPDDKGIPHPTAFRVQQPCPFNPQLVVFSIYDEGDDINVYCLSLGQTEESKKYPPMRYVLDKRSPIFSGAPMSLGTFIHENANELMALSEDMTTAEKERTLVVQYLRNLPPGKFANDAAEDIENGEHEDEEEEDEEPEPEPATTAPAVAAGKPS